MESKNYLQYLVEKIHSTIVATVDEEGLPITCAIDIMDYDEKGLYFITAKGKGFYNRLVNRKYLSLTALKGETTMESVSISLSGKVRDIGSEKVKYIFDKNKYMYELYPTEESRRAITVFQIYEGTGEYFDLSKKPIYRENFTFGGCEEKNKRYYVSNKCVGCNKCYTVCPQKCIDISVTPVKIINNNCLHCGNCYELCPVKAIVKEV